MCAEVLKAQAAIARLPTATARGTQTALPAALKLHWQAPHKPGRARGTTRRPLSCRQAQQELVWMYMHMACEHLNSSLLLTESRSGHFPLPMTAQVPAGHLLLRLVFTCLLRLLTASWASTSNFIHLFQFTLGLNAQDSSLHSTPLSLLFLRRLKTGLRRKQFYCIFFSPRILQAVSLSSNTVCLQTRVSIAWGHLQHRLLRSRLLKRYNTVLWQSTGWPQTQKTWTPSPGVSFYTRQPFVTLREQRPFSESHAFEP